MYTSEILGRRINLRIGKSLASRQISATCISVPGFIHVDIYMYMYM